ncbi:heparan-alpha-glucosaminide N-acetyltransferase-like isoform X2 [Babylonia areolata]|uniref:heparan-alpha-glucosaminide N-acetyltransferase-like isoform X2 n=1 Tax=Babylonia areolata TaxID=304850 RepID=UPI003FCF3711
MASTERTKSPPPVLFVAGVVMVLVTMIQAEAMVPIIPPLCDSDSVPQLGMDTARLTVDYNQSSDVSVTLYTQTSECYQCDLLPVAMVTTKCTVLVDTRWPFRVEVRTLAQNSTVQQTSPSCSEAQLTQHFLEGGEYYVYVQLMAETFDPSIECHWALSNSPPDANIPIYVALALAVLLAFLWVVFKSLYRRGVIHRIVCFWSTESVMADFGPPTSINPTDDQGTSSGGDAGTTRRKERLRSLDTFRGLSLSVMIFVNYGGGGYWWFSHSKWDGLTVADLVFPWFVYIMGTAMMLSFQSQLQRGVSKVSMLWRIVRRSLILFTLGLLINSGGKSDGIDLSQFRIPGVLQRFAGTYLIVASLHLLFAKPYDDTQYGRLSAVRDIVDFWPEWVFHLTLVAIHTLLTFALHVPGCPTGYLGPGGLAEGSVHMNCTGGAAGYIDRQVFGDSHIYQGPTCKEIYHTTVPYDPEGLLGTLTSVFICFLGLQAGKILFIHKDWVQRTVRFLIWAVMLGLIAGILCKFSKEDGWIPINKNLWSLSFVLALAAMAFFLLAVCYVLIDVYKVWNGAPFYYPGMNPILLYVGHELLAGRFPVGFDVAATHAAQLAMNLWGTTFWVLVALYLFCKGIFISV